MSGERRPRRGRNFKKRFFGGVGGGDETVEKKTLCLREEAGWRKEGRKGELVAVPIKKGAPFRPSPRDKSESLKPHSGSHKDEIKSE